MPLQIHIEKIFVNTGLTKKPLSPHPLPADCRLMTAKRTVTGYTAVPDCGWAANTSKTAKTEIPGTWYGMHRVAIATMGLLHGTNSCRRLTILASLLAWGEA